MNAKKRRAHSLVNLAIATCSSLEVLSAPLHPVVSGPRSARAVSHDEDPRAESAGGELPRNQADYAHRNECDSDSSSLTEEQRAIANELESLFGSDLSDEDPSYKPPGDDKQLSSTDDSMDDNSMTLVPKQSGNEKQEDKQIVEAWLNDILDRVCKQTRLLKRWREVDTENWSVNKSKKRRAEGLPYVSKKKARPAKVPRPVNCDTCQYKCTANISEGEREKLCRHYWHLDFKGKKNFLLSNVHVQEPKRILVARQKQRTYSKKCFLPTSNGKLAVCQKFMTTTLCISPDTIKQAIKNRDALGLYTKQDKRGKKEPPNKTKQHIYDQVKAHIESFPCMEAHYIRKDSKRKYLDSSLSVSKMYKLYLDHCEECSIDQPVSEITYRRIFSTNYNLSFFVPKKDQCLTCTNYVKSKEKANLEQNYQEHIARKENCNREKQNDKERANNDSNFMTITFDLQAVLQIPSGKIGLLYYVRKLCVYNLTIYEAPTPNNAYCFSWSEINGKRGSCEIGSILYHYLAHCLPENISEVSLFSDTCGGQNRNQFIAAMLLWAVQHIDHLNIIEQKFLESGHSYMEVDSMHSAIESAKRNATVYTMYDWLAIYENARCKRKCKVNQKIVTIEPYKVKEFKYHEFIDLKTLADEIILNRTKDDQGNQVKWLKIKRMRYMKGETKKIFFNYDMSDTFSYIDVSNTFCPRAGSSRNTRATHNSPAVQRRANVSHILPGDLKRLYTETLPISQAKKNDLIKLCQKGVIPEELHGWYGSLRSNSNVRERLPQPDVDECEDEIGE